MRFCVVLIIIVGINCPYSYGQLPITLSAKHQQKLSTIKSGHKRLVKYYKYYKSDSAKSVKKLNRHYKEVLDSAYRAEKKDARLQRKLGKGRITLPNEVSELNSINAEIQHCWSLARDTTASDSARQFAKQKTEMLVLMKAKRYPGFQYLSDHYHMGDSLNWHTIGKQIPGLDTLKGLFDSSPKDLFARAEKLGESKLTNLTQVGALGNQFGTINQLKGLPDSYKKQFCSYTNTDSLKETGKQRAVKEAANYFTNHSDKLQGAQAQASKLLSKYRDYTNSADLSNAVKQTSQKGKTFAERIVLSGNFNIVNLKPLSIDLSPFLGYKFTSRFFAGIGFNYRYTYRDSVRNYASPTNNAFKVLASYNILKGIYSYAEWDKNSIVTKTNEGKVRSWRDNYYIGLGKRILIQPKLYMTMTALYNLNAENRNPVSPSRFHVRIGFQLSELAARKKKIYYDPNR